MTLSDRGNGFWSALSYDIATPVTALRSQIQDPICASDHIQVVFDHDNAVAGVYNSVENVQQSLDVCKMQPGGGFIQDVERFASG